MFHEFHACQHADAPTLVLSSGLGGSGRYWADDLALLTRDYRVLVYDHAGTGRSPAVLPGIIRSGTWLSNCWPCLIRSISSAAISWAMRWAAWWVWNWPCCARNCCKVRY